MKTSVSQITGTSFEEWRKEGGFLGSFLRKTEERFPGDTVLL